MCNEGGTMSYSYDVKEELSSINHWKDEELLKAEFLGYILTRKYSK